MTFYSESQLRQVIWKAFTKLHGLTLKSEAVDYLVSQLTQSSIPSNHLVDAINYIATTYVTTTPSKGMVDAEALKRVVQGLFKIHQSEDVKMVDPRHFIWTISCNKTPKYVYNVHQKNFERCKDAPKAIGEAGSKTKMFIERFEMLRQRLLRHDRLATGDLKVLEPDLCNF